jgi:signal transduction histidine kinase
MTGMPAITVNPRHMISLLALSFGIVLTLFFGVDIWREHEEFMKEAGSTTGNLARVLEQHARESMRRVELSMMGAAGELMPAGDFSATDRDAWQQRLRSHLPKDGLIGAFTIGDRDGAVVLSTRAQDLSAAPSMAERDYFTAQRDRAGQGMVVGAPVKSRVDGNWIVPVSLRLGAPGGPFQGVLLGRVEPGYFQRFYDAIDTGANGFVALFQRDGWIMVRAPHDDAALQRNWSDSPLFREHLPLSDTQTVRQVTAIDGVERIYSYRALKDYPMVVTVGRSLTDARADWREGAWRTGAVLFLTLGGLCGATLVLVRQLRQRETAQRALSSSEKRFRSLVNLSHDLFWETDAEHRFVGQMYSPTSTILPPVAPEIGKTRWEIPYVAPDEDAWQRHREMIDARLPFRNFELARPDPNGGVRYVQVSGEPVYDEHGVYTGYRGVSSDIAERKRAEEQLVALNADLEAKVRSRTGELAKALEAANSVDRMKSEFMANVTHELRTPLNSVIGFADLLNDGAAGPLNPKQAAFSADILAGGQRLLEIVNGILEMSRLDAAALEPEPVEIGAVLQERVDAHRKAASGRGLSLRLDVAPGVGVLPLDPKALRRMLDALLDNAVRFNREGGSVEVRARLKDGRLEIAVADTGIGIAQADLPRLGQPLLQLDAGLARQHGGAGLGLALARRLAELHGGSLEVTSELGQGSTFTLFLPCGQTS